MRWLIQIIACVVAGAAVGAAQNPPASQESKYETRYSMGVIDDATFYANMSHGAPSVLNQVLLEPTFSMHYMQRWSFSTTLIQDSKTFEDTATQVHVREAYGGLSAGDFDFTVGRKLLRWGTGYAFTAAGVLDPPRVATDPTDRLNVNEGRDMVKVDWVHGPHAITAAWSTAVLAQSGMNVRDTAAFRYNVLIRGFDTALIAGKDRGADAFGGFTFTRVVGRAWEVHGEAMWREQAAVLLGAKYTLPGGLTFIGEFYTPPNTAYFRDVSVSRLAGRQHYAFVNAGKTRLRERPGWKEWDLSGGMVTNLDDHSYTGVFDVNRWFGNHFSAYTHVEIPVGSRTSDYGSAPYASSDAVGIRFQL